MTPGNYTPIRWKQRFQNFEKAYQLFTRITEVKNPSEGEKMGIIQAFEMCFELSWKVMKDFLHEGGYIVNAPRDVIKQALQDGLIRNGHHWLEALASRNETAHAYDETKMLKIQTEIQTKYSLVFQELYLFFKEKYDA